MKIDRFLLLLLDDVIVADVARRLCVPVTVAVLAHVKRHLLSDFQQMRHDLSRILLQIVVVDRKSVLREVSWPIVGSHESESLFHHVSNSRELGGEELPDQKGILRKGCAVFLVVVVVVIYCGGLLLLVVIV